MTKALIPTEMSKEQSYNTKTPQKVRLHTAIADRLRTATCSWNNYSHPTGVAYRFYSAHLPTHRNSCAVEGKNMQILLYSDMKVVYKYILFERYFKWYGCVAKKGKIAFMLI